MIIEDVIHLVSLSLHDASSTQSTKLRLKCFCESFKGIVSDPDIIGDLPSSNKPVDGCGLLIDLSDKRRWQLCATWILKLLSKCLTEVTLYVEGLANTSFVCCMVSFMLGMLLCRWWITNFILSIITILSADKEGLPLFRNVAYDSSMGICLSSLYSSCSEDVVKSTAADLVNVFLQSLWRTKSKELKVALCTACARIVEVCPPHTWQLESLVSALCHPEPFSPLIECF